MTPFGLVFAFSPFMFLFAAFVGAASRRFLPELWERPWYRLSVLIGVWAFGVISLPILLGWMYVFFWAVAFGNLV